MTVRWKPLLILSGLFVVIACVGLVAIAYTLLPRTAADILPAARAERAAKQFDNALLHYRRALQHDGKNAAIYEEMAAMFAEWEEQSPPEKAAERRGERLTALANAARYGATLKSPRRLLLEDAMQHDEPAQAVYWAKEVLKVDASNTEAQYVLTAEALDGPAPNLVEIKRGLAALETAQAPAVRIAWIKARLAQSTNDTGALETTLAQGRTLALSDAAGPADRAALLRLRALDAETTTDLGQLPARVEALEKEAARLVAGRAVAPGRIVRVSYLFQRLQRTLLDRAVTADAPTRDKLKALVDAIDEKAEPIFKKALVLNRENDLQVYLSYADHLRFRAKRTRCLEVVDEALKLPLAGRKNAAPIVMALHAVAAEMALADLDDPARAEKAAPHIQELIGCTYPRFQGLGHLFHGAIDLERAGATAAATTDQTTLSAEPDTGAAPAAAPAGRSQPQPSQAQRLKLRASALNHLKLAAALLPDVAEAQARYGVALVLAKEQSLGRQYLQKALRQGNLDPQYQIWAAWSMVQAGYPEEADPIVTHLFAEIAAGRQPRALEGTLHLLGAEIHQARRTPEELKKARAEYERAVAAGQPVNSAMQLRQAQIDVQLGHPEEALKRLETMRTQGQGGPGAEQLAVLTLQQMGKADDARATLDQARKRFPRSEELVALDAALLVRADKAREADQVLAAFLAHDPESIPAGLLRAQVLADHLGDLKEARKLLASLAERSENSVPLVQLALLDMRLKDHEATAVTIARIRSRWKESADADVLAAQLAIDQGNTQAALAALDAALKKDPNNKMVQFYKAQLDSRTGAPVEAARMLEGIVKERPTKELDSGQTLTAAAESALANLEMRRGDLDAAIGRFQDLKNGELGQMARSDRWQLIAAYDAKGEWEAARKELGDILSDLKNPPSNEERISAAHLYRRHGERDAAQAQLDPVLKVSATHPGAVIAQAALLSDDQKLDAAAALLRKTIAADGQKPHAVFFLLLAALENRMPPADTARSRSLAVIDQGLQVQTDAIELVKARYQLVRQGGDPKGATAFVAAKARDSRNEELRRFLAEVYVDQKDFAAAEGVLDGLLKKNPNDAARAASLVQLALLQANEPASAADDAQRRAALEKAGTLIRRFRTQFPSNVLFLQYECSLAEQQGDLARAIALTQEMDRIDKNATTGPLTRARLYTAQKRFREVAGAYAEALERNPRLQNVRIQLAQTRLKLGEADEALRQATLVLDVDKGQAEALLIEARAMAEQAGTESQVAARRAQAIALLEAMVQKKPDFAAAYHEIADIALKSHHRDQAIAALKAALKAVPDDAAGLAKLIELLTEPREGGAAPTAAELADAEALAQSAAQRDTQGNLALAVAVGYHKAGQLDRAMPWAEKAAAKLDAPVVHLNYGDLLLSVAENARDPLQARGFFQRAVAQYDLVLRTQSTSVAAVNNKAWILHTYLGDSQGALELALGLLKRSNPATLPGEFFDTLGAVQEATGRARDAEDSYALGLRKTPDHPVLNFHMGKLLLAEHNRKAISYLEKAYASRGRLSPKMANEVESLLKKASR